MRPMCVSIVALSSTFAIGCFSARDSAPDSFVCQSIRNVVQSPIRDLDEVRFIKFTKVQAEKSWDQFCHSSGLSFRDPYHRGFVEGFIDYVQAGGNGEPPYLPPFRYRATPFRSAENASAIEDWYAGFRHGAAVAKESGLRELNYVPLPGYGIPKDPNAPVSTEVVKSSSTNANPAVEGSPWDQPGFLPMQQPSPPPFIAPKPREVPERNGVPNIPMMPPQQSLPPQTFVPPQISEIRQVSGYAPIEIPQPILQPQQMALAPPQVFAYSSKQSDNGGFTIEIPLAPAQSSIATEPKRFTETSQPVDQSQQSVLPSTLSPPHISVTSTVQSPVTPTITIIQPARIPSNSGSDPWRSAAPKSLLPEAGTN
jgi:hypothetical protein